MCTHFVSFTYYQDGGHLFESGGRSWFIRGARVVPLLSIRDVRCVHLGASIQFQQVIKSAVGRSNRYGHGAAYLVTSGL